nr:hypothetical protein CFP56_11668 [Quercus suber]
MRQPLNSNIEYTALATVLTPLNVIVSARYKGSEHHRSEQPVKIHQHYGKGRYEALTIGKNQFRQSSCTLLCHYHSIAPGVIV